MKTIGPKDLPLAEFHNALLTAIAPRPICFASTMDKDGNPNLSPFSFLIFLVQTLPALFSRLHAGCVIIPPNTPYKM